MRALLSLVAACAISACTTPESRFTSQELRYREDMLARYPPASEWREQHDQFGAFQRWLLTQPAPDSFAEHALAGARTHSTDVVSCRWGLVARPTLGPSFGGLAAAATGSFVDYVFLDADERVVVGYRRFFD